MAFDFGAFFVVGTPVAGLSLSVVFVLSLRRTASASPSSGSVSVHVDSVSEAHCDVPVSGASVALSSAKKVCSLSNGASELSVVVDCTLLP